MRPVGLALLFSVVGMTPMVRAIELRLVGVHTLARNLTVDGTRVGGLSGIDYDAANDRWIAVSDGRGANGPDRCYTLLIDYDEAAVREVRVVSATPLQSAEACGLDLEAVRVDPRDGSLWLAGEGDAVRGIAPAVFRSTRDGRRKMTLALPPEISLREGSEVGVRSNRNLESLTFTPDGSALWIGLEAPAKTRGAPPTATRGAITTLYRLTLDGSLLETREYSLDAWQLMPAAGKLADNGLAELLALPDGQLLALERSGAQDTDGRWRFSARLYEMTPQGGKRLVHDFERNPHRPMGNLEGMTWGRRVRNGRPTLVLVSDDNFSDAPDAAPTQIWVFEVSEDANGRQ
jgi:hypothetical protein